MKFENSEYVSVNGTSYQGKLEDISYARLVETFGEPTFKGDMDKISVEWCLKFEDGTVATIYDWKTPFKAVHNRLWHVGGFDYKAHEFVREALDFSPMRMDELPQHEQDEYNAYLDDTAFSSPGYPHED